MKKRNILWIGLALLIFHGSPLVMAENMPAISSSTVLPYDKKLTALSRILAGIVPQGDEWKSFLATSEWKEHHTFFQNRWATFKKQRVQPVELWRDGQIAISGDAQRTMNYPFSGPDFLNAYLFFQDADQYVFYSLEAPGKIPDLANMSSEQKADLFKDIRSSLSDIFRRQYFITKNMVQDFRTPYLKGNTCALLIFMAFHQNKIVSIEPVTLDPLGHVVALADVETSTHTKSVAATRITFLNPAGTKQQQLVYFSLDVSDQALVKHPEFLLYLDSLKPCSTFMKAASYLLHSQYFPSVRKRILETSDIIVQDDSGMPYRFFKADIWDIKIYGRYTKPVKDFNFGFQQDLDALYQNGPVLALPFSFGYHWWDHYSNVMIAVRKTPK